MNSTCAIPPTPPDEPLPGGFYRHKYGGLYQFVGVRQGDGGESLACYLHVWPFEQKPFERPLDEFRLRFTAVSEQAVQEAMRRDRAQAQADVTRAKSAAQG